MARVYPSSPISDVGLRSTCDEIRSCDWIGEACDEKCGSCMGLERKEPARGPVEMPYIHFLVSRSPSTLPARLIGEGELMSCLW